MIAAQFSTSYRYRHLLPGLDKAFDYLAKVAGEPPEDGRYEIDGLRVFAIVTSYETAPRVEKILEGHYNYLDIQYIAQGGPEAIYYMPAETAPITEDYDPAADLSSTTRTAQTPWWCSKRVILRFSCLRMRTCPEQRSKSRQR